MTIECADPLKECREMVRDFARAEIAPHVREWDEKAGCPFDVFRRLGGLGLMGILVPEEHGGVGLSWRSWERSRAGSAFPLPPTTRSARATFSPTAARPSAGHGFPGWPPERSSGPGP
jgi:alkylation response protein AidB-like acyl-CoA dehydrogenase